MEDNIKMYLGAIEYGSVDRINLAKDKDHRWAILNTVINLRPP
jgi:hypothetical protein